MDRRNRIEQNSLTWKARAQPNIPTPHLLITSVVSTRGRNADLSNQHRSFSTISLLRDQTREVWSGLPGSNWSH